VEGFVFGIAAIERDKKQGSCRRFKGQVYAQHSLIYINEPSGVLEN
jgi:hypothetical protein